MNYLTPEIQAAVLSSLLTVPRAAELSFLTDEIKAATYIQGADIKGLSEKVSPYSKELGGLISSSDPGTLRALVEEVAELIEHSDRLKVEMSYIPSKDFVSGLYDIFKVLGYKNFLLEFTTVPEAGTGARFYHNGNFIDISMFDLIKEKMKDFNFNL
ncbi:MAG: hypothetical protein UU74_C0043G0008 [Candidatus Woesebacteria bacterium GW2011_GWA1_41_7]|jgi:hypothetical protein|uniref:Uncharacterized protein n=1 Tax=Candidatus Woesebacteria bacterium GW2011_GWA1_41_7 TaxID=1618556 RepID=A0A0G0WUI4_9BACT|nr:MAG: hypothetical protein UU74_C0043G0008 [Candidatus Woesebacteria bacterium GW2011_GWA1_41_7]